MAYNVKFLRGTSTAYANLLSKDSKTFYYTTDNDQLYIGNVKLSDNAEIAAAVARIGQNETDIKALQEDLATLMGGEGGTSIQDMIDASIEASETQTNATITALDGRVKAVEDDYLKNADKTELANATALVQTNLDNLSNGQVTTNKNDIATLKGDAATEGSVAKAVADLKTVLDGDIDAVEAKADAAQSAADKAQGEVDAVEVGMGNVDDLSTTNKTVVGAINEVLAAVGTGGTAAVVTMTSDTTTEGALKSYTIKQGTTLVGTIDIPKDMVVESGEVVTNPEGQPEGTYIKLVLANVTDPLYINVGHLVDIYKAQESAAQVQLTIDSSTREISAAIVAGSIGTTELADNAVVTAKIADANVTKAKLSSEVQASLDKADAAATKAEFDAEVERATQAEAAAEANAKAYAEEKATAAETAAKAHAEEKATAAETAAKAYADGLAVNYATAAQGAKADTAVQEVVTGATNGTIEVDGTEVAVAGLGSAAFVETSAFDAEGSATAALDSAKAYTDTALTWGEIA